MSDAGALNLAVLEPLFKPWEEPTGHRVRAKEGKPAEVVPGRRPSRIEIAQRLRGNLREWRESYYAGASDTTRHLLNHWFERSHRSTTPAGEEIDFKYHFCQREAVETFIYLHEIRKLRCLSQIVAGIGGANAELAALGIPEEEDAWSRQAFKLATGAGKTKCMSLCMVWSYFHALRESDSDLARHFVVIAPNLTVYERLKEDFGDGRIFDSDPLIPSEWRGDWNMSIVLQDEASGASTGGTLYLTNIHRLYDKSKQKDKDADTYDWMGPKVSKAKALDTGAALRDRITAHPRILVFNDEAHHVWDPDSAWNEAIRTLHETIKARSGGGLVAQLDFSATPKDNKGNVFKHVVCDTPLGEAVDAGIVKTPVIGKASDKLQETKDPNAAYRYERHLRLGYECWRKSRDEWKKGGKKALLFVMCEDTKAADEITQRLNSDESFKDLNGVTINLHTNLKGKIKKEGKGPSAREVFVESEKEISDDDLRALRKLSRELDENRSPYSCIVSVLMLREGWDVRNVTTIVPLRPYSSKAMILPEQTLGRGLRRMTPPGQANELVTCVEHPAFASLYEQELQQEGLPIEIVDVDKVPTATVSIFPDPKKPIKDLEIAVPRLSGGHKMVPKVEGLTLDMVRTEFKKFKPLPLGGRGKTEIEYEGRHLFTNEIVERMTINLPLLATGAGAVSFFVRQLEYICKVQGIHSAVAPLLETFLQEILFEKRADLYDSAWVPRLSTPDVEEHVRAVFVPLIRAKTIATEARTPAGEPMLLSEWKPYQVTHSERRPALQARNTLFNLVPCNNATLEAGFTDWLARKATDVAAFAKNAGPQCLRIDYLAGGDRLAFYTPDFIIRAKDGNYFLLETKGREDKDVHRKARAALAWCEAASTKDCKWEYVYLPQGIFERLSGSTIAELARTCAPSLQDLLHEETEAEKFPLFTHTAQVQEEAPATAGFVDTAILDSLPPRYRKAVEDSVALFLFLKNKGGMNFAAAFNPLLGSMDEAARGLMLKRLLPHLPATVPDQKAWFEPYTANVDRRLVQHYDSTARNLKKTLVFKNGVSPVGLLRTCLDYALNDKNKIGGVFDTIRETFKVKGALDLLDKVAKINDFRNTYVAHQEKDLADSGIAESSLKLWITGLQLVSGQSGGGP